MFKNEHSPPSEGGLLQPDRHIDDTQAPEGWPEELSVTHRAQLEASAISPEVAKARGYESVSSRLAKTYGFSKTQVGCGGLLIPLWSVFSHDRAVSYQLRPDNPRTTKDGKTIKYESVRGAGNIIDVPPAAREQVDDPSVPLWITEGAKKADSAVSRGLCCVALAGVWNWKGKNEKGGNVALPDWDSIALKRRLVYLAFDSDILTKVQVRAALARLHRFLSKRGAEVLVVRIPSRNGAKVGLDDFFAAGGSVDDLLATCTSDIPAPDEDDKRGGRELIDVTTEDLAEISRTAWKALQKANAKSPKIFRYGGAMAWLRPGDDGERNLEIMQEPHMRHVLGLVAQFMKTHPERGPKLVYPPVPIVQDMLCAPSQKVPSLRALVRAPLLTIKGSVLRSPGYNAESRLYYAPAKGLEVPAVSDAPTQGEIDEARSLIVGDLLGEFPFVDQASRAGAVALFLLPFMREVVDGPTPLHLLEKPAPGTGASLMVEAISAVVLGRPASVTTEGKDEEEWRKRITAVLRGGASIVLIDNLRRRLDSAALSAAITAETWEDRILGKSETTRPLPVRCTWVGTGNNPSISDELARRSISIRLDAKMDRPEEREGWRHPNLRDWATKNRGRLVWAALTLGRAWISAGRPPDTSVAFGSFEAWFQTIGGVLQVAGIPGLLDNRQEFRDRADLEGEAWRTFVSAWWERFGALPQKAKDLRQLADDAGVDLGTGKERAQTTKLGKALERNRDRRYGRLRLIRWGEDGNSKARLWVLENTETPSAPSANQPKNAEGAEDAESVPCFRAGAGENTLPPSTSPSHIERGETPSALTAPSANSEDPPKRREARWRRRF